MDRIFILIKPTIYTQFSTWLVLNGIIGALFGGLTGVAEVNKRPEATVRSV